MNARQKAASKAGKIGGKAKVPKGFAMMDKSKLKEVAAKGGRIRRKRKAVHNSNIAVDTSSHKV